MTELRRLHEDEATILAASSMAAIPDPLSPTAGTQGRIGHDQRPMYSGVRSVRRHSAWSIVWPHRTTCWGPHLVVKGP